MKDGQHPAVHHRVYVEKNSMTEPTNLAHEVALIKAQA